MSIDRVDSLTLEGDGLVLVRRETFCSTFQSRSKSDRFLVYFLSGLAGISFLFAIVSHSRDLVQIETVTGEISCKTFGWFYQSDCSNTSAGQKTMLLRLNQDLGVSGVAFGVAHLVEGLAFGIVAISLACYNPHRPIRCFRVACALVIFTIFAFVSAMNLFFVLNVTTLARSSRFERIKPLWGFFISMVNVALIVVALFGSCCQQNCLTERSDFEQVSEDTASKSGVKTLSLEDLEEFERATGRRFSVSMSPPTHRRGSSAFTAILGLTPLQRIISPNGQAAYSFADDSESSRDGSPLFDELNELTRLTVSDAEFGMTPRSDQDDSFQMRRVENWSAEDVAEWARLRLVEPQIAALLHGAGIDGRTLMCLNAEKMKEIGLNTEMTDRLERGLDELAEDADEMDPNIESSMIEYRTPGASPRI